jgi:hypothetical protein
MKSMQKYIEGAFRNFIGSFRTLDRKILYVAAYNLVFYLALVAAYNKFTALFMKKAEPVLAIAGTDFVKASDTVMQAHAATIQNFYKIIFAYGVLFIIAVFAVYAVTNLLVWAAITEKKLKKLKKKFIAGFVAVNAIWAAALILGFAAIIRSIRPGIMPYWLFAFALLYIHLATLSYIFYFKKAKIGKTFKSAFSGGISKLQYFIVPYALAAIVYTAVNYALLYLAKIQVFANITFYFVIFVFFMAWLRIYIYSFARNLA